MRKPRFSDEQIAVILAEAAAGVPAAELCRRHGMSDTTFYTWRSRRWQQDERKSGCAELRRALAQQQEQIRRLRACLENHAGGESISG
ncbi:transposase [Pseudomonas sp. UBA6310]|uniref:transposase n=1 Tax=Pseudomonas sp. UBA6310 TaxID=1947327 RepID=UPI00257D33B0|nr:transposase [Pseudomonas sp. UBA6310]